MAYVSIKSMHNFSLHISCNPTLTENTLQPTEKQRSPFPWASVNVWHFHLKPWLHVQLLHAIILGSGRRYRCQSMCVCDVTSKMSADEELLLLSAATSAATISLAAFGCNLTLMVNMITSQIHQHEYYVMWFHRTLPLAATLLPHAIIAHETTSRIIVQLF